jgi:hypothetical protein
MPPTCVTPNVEHELPRDAMAPFAAPADVDEVRPEDREVLLLTERYAFAARLHLPVVGRGGGAAEAVDLVACSSFFAAAKVYRALVGRAQPSWFAWDARDSAATAVLALDRSQAAWLALVDAGLVERQAVEALLNDLVRVRAALLVTFPMVAAERLRRAEVEAGGDGGVQNKRPEA